MERAITVLTDVKDLAELLDGARVEQAKLVPAAGQLRLVVECTRAMPERQRVVRSGLFKRAKIPWTRCQLTFNRLTSVTVRRLEGMPPEDMPLLSCEAVPGGYRLTIQTPDALRFIASLEQLDGAFEDVGSPLDSP